MYERICPSCGGYKKDNREMNRQEPRTYFDRDQPELQDESARDITALKRITRSESSSYEAETILEGNKVIFEETGEGTIRTMERIFSCKENRKE